MSDQFPEELQIQYLPGHYTQLYIRADAIEDVYDRRPSVEKLEKLLKERKDWWSNASNWGEKIEAKGELNGIRKAIAALNLNEEK